MNSNNENLKRDPSKIKGILKIGKSKDEIANELLISLKNPSLLFSNQGPCGSIQIMPYPDRYFVAQEFNDNKDDLRASLEVALKRFGYTSIGASDFYQSEKLICKIAALIQGTPFGVYQLTTSQNRNIYLELGIAVGLGRAFVLIKDEGAKPARIVGDIEYYPISDYLDIKYEFGGKLNEYIWSIGKFKVNNAESNNQNKRIVIFHGGVESVDITVTLAKYYKEQGFTPVIIGEFQKNLANYLKNIASVEPNIIQSRDQIIESIRTSRFGIYRIHRSASADSFFALGVGIALNKPFLVLKHKNEDVPSDLSYLSPVSYVGFTDLEKILPYIETP